MLVVLCKIIEQFSEIFVQQSSSNIYQLRRLFDFVRLNLFHFQLISYTQSYVVFDIVLR